VQVLADRDDISAYDLEQLAHEMFYGEFMGVVDTYNGRELTREQLVGEAYAMGGEPSFFGEEFEDV
jgi:hypothetical protein